MADKLTELEKTILLAFLALTKGSTQKYLTKEEVKLRFIVRQRKNVERIIDSFVKEGFLTKFKNKYALTDRGLKRASALLVEGAQLFKT